MIITKVEVVNVALVGEILNFNLALNFTESALRISS